MPRNPGPGGWGWVVPDGPWANGFDPDTTNQRMELMAVLDALRTIEGPVEVVSDSTYVVNCFRDGWWKGWLKRGWKNSKKEPVANRDIWEPLIDLYRSREEEITFTWVKGHAGDEYNDIADRLAVEASHTGRGRHGVGTPTISAPRRDRRKRVGSGGCAEAGVRRRVLVLVGADRPGNPHHGVQPPQLGGYDPNPIADEVRRQITEILVAKAELHPDLVVVTGLRLGAETLAAEAAAEAELPFVAVLPFPDPEIKWPAATQRRFHELLAEASATCGSKRRCQSTTGRPARRWTAATAGCARSPRKRSSCGTTTNRGSERSCRRSNRCCPTMCGSSALEHALQRRL